MIKFTEKQEDQFNTPSHQEYVYCSDHGGWTLEDLQFDPFVLVALQDFKSGLCKQLAFDIIEYNDPHLEFQRCLEFSVLRSTASK